MALKSTFIQDYHYSSLHFYSPFPTLDAQDFYTPSDTYPTHKPTTSAPSPNHSHNLSEHTLSISCPPSLFPPAGRSSISSLFALVVFPCQSCYNLDRPIVLFLANSLVHSCKAYRHQDIAAISLDMQSWAHTCSVALTGE